MSLSYSFCCGGSDASNLAARVRDQAVAARERMRITEELYLLAGSSLVSHRSTTYSGQRASDRLNAEGSGRRTFTRDGSLVVKAGFHPRTCSTRRISLRPAGALKKIKRQGAAPIRCRRQRRSCLCAPDAAPWALPDR